MSSYGLIIQRFITKFQNSLEFQCSQQILNCTSDSQIYFYNWLNNLRRPSIIFIFKSQKQILLNIQFYNNLHLKHTYLKKEINLNTGPSEEKELKTGKDIFQDLTFKGCNIYVRWKLSQKYKIIIDKAFIQNGTICRLIQQLQNQCFQAIVLILKNNLLQYIDYFMSFMKINGQRRTNNQFIQLQEFIYYIQQYSFFQPDIKHSKN
ncbi:hypothetical protein pb186bvf_018938 [Paramecium bursaria]